MTSAALSMIMREGQRRNQLLVQKQKESTKETSVLKSEPSAQSYISYEHSSTPKSGSNLPKIIIVAAGVAIVLSAYKFGKKVF